MADERDKATIIEMATDIRYMRATIQEMKATLEVLKSEMVTRAEVESRFERLQQEIDKRFVGAHERIDDLDEKKVDNKDFEPYRAALNRVNWTIITAVVGALLAVIGLNM